MEVTISLGPELMPRIESAAQHYGKAVPDYIVEVLKQAVPEPYDEELEKLLLEGINGGPATPMTRQDWDDIKTRGLACIPAKEVVESAVTEPFDQKLADLIAEGLASGPAIEVTPEYWEKKRAALAQKLGR